MKLRKICLTMSRLVSGNVPSARMESIYAGQKKPLQIGRA